MEQRLLGKYPDIIIIIFTVGGGVTDAYFGCLFEWSVKGTSANVP